MYSIHVFVSNDVPSGGSFLGSVFFQQIPHSVEKQIHFNLFIVFLIKNTTQDDAKTIVFGSILRFLFVYVREIAKLNKSKL